MTNDENLEKLNNLNNLQNSSKLPKHVVRDGVKWLMMPSKIMLDGLSEWPENQNNITRTLHVLCVTSYFFVAIGHFFFIIDKNADIGSISFAISFFILIIETTTRRVLLYFYREQLSKILTKVYYEFWPSKMFGIKMHNELTKQSRYLFLYCTGYTLSSFLCVMQFMLAPFFDRTMPLVTKYPFAWQDSPYYELLYVWQSFLSMELVFGVCSLDLFFMSLLCNCVAQFKLLRECLGSKLENAIRKEKSGSRAEAKKVLLLFIERHNQLIRTCHEINHVFTYFSLIQCLASIGTVCLSTFVMTAVPETLGIAFTYLMGHISEIFIYCYMGNDLIIESTKISKTAFECGWHLSSEDKDLQKALIMIMIRSQKSIYISAGGFGILNLASFMNLVKFSFSAYTVLNSMLMKQDIS